LKIVIIVGYSKIAKILRIITKNKPTLIIDTREKHPWNFEADDAFEEVVYRKLDYGDYSLEGLEDVVSIERKLDCNELFTNFTQGKKRILAEFTRMSECQTGVVVVEQTWEDILNPDSYYINTKKINKRHPKMPVAVVADRLVDLITNSNIQVVCAGNRAQSIARAILLNTYNKHINESNCS
jgi:hypothetical protein